MGGQRPFGTTINPGSRLSKDAELRMKKLFLDFFVERMFRIFDKDNTWTISQEEFIETVQQFTKDDDDAN